MNEHLDQRDQLIIAQRLAHLAAVTGPRDGDVVEFTDGTVRRISHLWRLPDGEPDQAQTSSGGSFYLGRHGMSFSGALYPPVPADSLIDTGRTRAAEVWIFHHDQRRAHKDVHATIPFRVYRCALPAPQ
ncbi:hypothetical protein [Actinocatenispora rupis]|uniref:Uncharacterized protein n=1 Tax=Actinocatenispora rupis TaxID=519421 RepID=A0A8J3J895_9ACTN|nr:hypothetical protein [Actinocatenispora rupis]GID10203.1 hypothetical protein Aru02nite_10920 [Actinocatenispora rupis]